MHTLYNMKKIIQQQLPDLILGQIPSQEFLSLYNKISWLGEYEKVESIKNVEVGAVCKIISDFTIDSSSAPIFKIDYLVFQLTELKRIENHNKWSLGHPGLRVVGSISDLELKLESLFDDKGERQDKFTIVNSNFDIEKLAFHPR